MKTTDPIEVGKQVKIIGMNHPWKGSIGTVVSEPKKLIGVGAPMQRVKLLDHVQCFYVRPGDMEAI